MLGAGAAALGGIAIVLDKSVKAALAGQASQARLNTALTATHQSVAKMTPALLAAEAASRKMGFTDDMSRSALAKLEVATGSTKKSISDLSVAEDIARFKHTDLTTASQMLAMAMTGSQRAVKQLGIVVSPVTANLDALKASHVNLTTASGHALEAHAKLLDKMATGNAIIQTVSEKLHGQADAFATTAAGGMEVFNAQITHIEEALGNLLLPVIQSVVNWVNAHWGDIGHVFQTVFNAIKPIINGLGQIISDVVQAIKDNWATIGPIVQHVENAFKVALNNMMGVIHVIIDIIHGDWGKAWEDFKHIIVTALNAAGPLILDALGLLGRAALALGKAILDGILAGLAALGRLVLKALGAIATAIAGVAGDAVNAAIQVGKELVNGIIGGVESMAGSLLNKLKSIVSGAINFVKSGFGIFSPSKVTATQIGVPLAQGVIEGWLTGSAALPAKMAASVTTAVQAAIKVVAASKTAFTSAFGGFTSIADQMFSGVAGSMQTPAGKLLAKLTDKHNAAGLQAAIDAARANLGTVTGAVGIEDPVAVKAAQQQLDDALYNQKVASLQKQDALEQKQLTATNAVKQIAFDKALVQLQDQFAKGHTSTKVAMTEIEKLLRSYGITFGNVGRDVGYAWAQGLKDAILTAAKHGGSLAGVLQQQAAGLNVPHIDTGGLIAQSGLAVVHKGEHVIPAGGGMGGNTYNLTVNSLDPRSAATAVVEAITVFERSNGQRYARA